MDDARIAVETGVDGVDDRIATRPRTLGEDRVRESVPVREIAGAGAGLGMAAQVPLWGEQSSVMGRLQALPVLTYVKATIEGSEDVFEGKNAESGGMRVCLSGSAH